jgi:hypothetical protein
VSLDFFPVEGFIATCTEAHMLNNFTCLKVHCGFPNGFMESEFAEDFVGHGRVQVAVYVAVLLFPKGAVV